MTLPNKFLIEGLDRLGKDTLIGALLNKLGFRQVLHFSKPETLQAYVSHDSSRALQMYQEESFRTLFRLLRAPDAGIICNRAHLGECVYAPLYRGYDGDYVFELERQFVASSLTDVRLILLTEDLDRSSHFVDDGLSLGDETKRRDEQARFCHAFEQSILPDKRVICVTDQTTGGFRTSLAILDDAL